MIKIHNLGFPRIGLNRELKKALEAYWRGEVSQLHLEELGATLRKRHWEYQSGLDLVPVGDFSLYDQVLDMSFTLGNIPERFKEYAGSPLDQYFRLARGQSAPKSGDAGSQGIPACEMTKWFNTNYHYLVPEFLAQTEFSLDASRLLKSFQEAQALGLEAKPVVLGPLSYLACGKVKDGSNKLDLLPKLLPVYKALFQSLAQAGAVWIQVDEPILCTELEPAWHQAFKTAYAALSDCSVKLLLTSYFGSLAENSSLVLELDWAGFHLDAINGREDLETLLKAWPKGRVLSLGVIDGRNIWKTDLTATLDFLEPIAEALKDYLWIAPSCSLLHVPIDLADEKALDPEIRSWLAFARQKLEELQILAKGLNLGRSSIQAELAQNQLVLESRKRSPRVHSTAVQEALKAWTPELGQRKSPYEKRRLLQAAWLKLPQYPTTSIGSFPQTKEIRQVRKEFKAGKISLETYETALRNEIAYCVEQQEKLGLDVLVHGEAERNDMVEYFGEHLKGYAFSENGWVQSYGSRCVKPPILYGDIERPKAISLDWILYAQSLSSKPMKGMLTGPVSILNWSFVRDDQPRSISARQLALALREEVLDLEKAGIRIIQIDEAALREGLPLRKSQGKAYLDWAIEAFRICANGVADETQIHTHMCYSEFNDIIDSIIKMDTDVITIESSRSDMELLEAFKESTYPSGIGPGVYDIHSPNIPSLESMVGLMEKAASRIPAERLWVNPDCGLKTRQWSEVMPALSNMIEAARRLRASL